MEEILALLLGAPAALGGGLSKELSAFNSLFKANVKAPVDSTLNAFSRDVLGLDLSTEEAKKRKKDAQDIFDSLDTGEIKLTSHIKEYI